MLKIIFWISLAIIFYTYIGYTLILWLFTLLKKKNKVKQLTDSELPEVTHVIAAYNERDIIPAKLENCQNLVYPPEKIQHLWITDGSDDGSEELLHNLPYTSVLHNTIRKGKTAALNRAMKQVSTPITVFSDANSMLHEMSIKNLVNALNEDNVGCAAGEKRIVSDKKDKATGAGEGFYWNYESIIKELESEFGSTMGAVGELYAIKTEHFCFPPENTILDDFVVSLNTARRGYKIKYVNNAFASEGASLNIREEMKRKTRIAAGGFQTLFAYPGLLNFLKHPSLSFQFFSHKVLRWFFVPISFIALFLINIAIVLLEENTSLFKILLILQLGFYLLTFIGFLIRNKTTKFKLIFLPYYISMMNYSQIAGLIRLIRGKQKAAWEKVNRTH